ncbi:bactofilin family protein [Pseudothauera lacus]|uniref:Cell shape determination protein CcmA n=1 Tax=Pseudothauera lacus TaxID=2136175 RepID=A0A2T4IK71_9RHOO|nr:polymer-forming cytoskeletal protein [Pseudothauera lacus]PTD98167.1 cell shape determination protein CcmA [Pseudothauera lacus]
MFRKKPHAKSIEVTKLSSLIADNVEIVGDVVFSGGLRVDGRIEGNVINKEGANGLLVLSDKGSIKGRVKVYDAVVNGAVSGDIEVEHFLELQSNARVSGNITYSQLQLECGATIEGRLERTGEGHIESDDERGGDGKIVDLVSSSAQAAAR